MKLKIELLLDECRVIEVGSNVSMFIGSEKFNIKALISRSRVYIIRVGGKKSIKLLILTAGKDMIEACP